MTSTSKPRAVHPVRQVLPAKTLQAEMTVYRLSHIALANLMRVPRSRISAILRGERTITIDTALRLGIVFGTSAEFWLNLQQNYSLAIARRDHGRTMYDHVTPIRNVRQK